MKMRTDSHDLAKERVMFSTDILQTPETGKRDIFTLDWVLNRDLNLITNAHLVPQNIILYLRILR